MRRDYTLRATPRPPSLPPLERPGSSRRGTKGDRPKLRALHTWAGGLAVISAAYLVPIFVLTSAHIPFIVGIAAWVANVGLAVLLMATAPPSEYRGPVSTGRSSYERGGMGAYYAFQDWSSGGDCGGDGGAC